MPMTSSTLLSRIEPRKTALIVIDVQNDFCSPEGFKAKAGHDISAMAQMVPRLNDMIRTARKARVKVVFIRTSHDEETSSDVWLARKSRGLQPQAFDMSPCRPGTWGAEFYGIEPAPGEHVITKHRYSAFRGTSLDLILRSAGIQSVLVTGVTTEACVESTTREAFFSEYHVTLVSDCCASDFPESHDATLKSVARYFGPVVISEEIAHEWSTLPLTEGI